MDVIYYNPNNFGVNLKKVECQVFLNEKYLGDYHLDSLIHVASKSVFVVPASVSFDMVDVMKKGFNILINKEALIGVRGSTRVGRSGIYFNVPIQYETKFKLPIP
jgi:LEA14-like dessication related protein